MHGIPYLFGYLPIRLRMYTRNGGNVKKKANIKKQKAKLRNRFAGLFEQILRLRCAQDDGFWILDTGYSTLDSGPRLKGRGDNVEGGVTMSKAG